jgi:hypothetical protein
MNGDISLSNALGLVLWYASELAFKWVPGAVQTVTGTGNPDAVTPSAPSISPITQPVTAQEAAAYLAQAFPSGAYDRFFHDWIQFVAISLAVSLLLGALIVYCAVRILQIRSHERRKFEESTHTVASQDISKTQLRWNRIIEQGFSDNEQQWRLAILEADIMLNELLDLLGYKGETMADKMKQVERADFNSIDQAWEAHKVRNSIAHQGAERLLSQREARRIIGLYENVFREFKFIDQK